MHSKADIFEIALFRQPFDAENIVADFAFELEVDEGILAQRGFEVGNRQFFEFLFARSRLTRFARVRREPCNKFFEFGGALFRLFIRLFLLTG